jgi:1,2-dihydroxy-3-keto-5-methylthiopentene dioxygenase
MTRLVTYREAEPGTPVADTSKPEDIAGALAAAGVRFEQWKASHVLAGDADQEAVLAAYHEDVTRLRAEGYTTVDVARLVRTTEADEEWAAKAAGARGKFLAEHTHDDDEVRFFVEGSGAFYLRIDGDVRVVLCEAGDLLSVPAGTRHWFDMGADPAFAAIRFFRIPEGWVGNFTGDDIASRFPTYDELTA